LPQREAAGRRGLRGCHFNNYTGGLLSLPHFYGGFAAP
jgi:hypothetical protein